MILLNTLQSLIESAVDFLMRKYDVEYARKVGLEVAREAAQKLNCRWVEKYAEHPYLQLFVNEFQSFAKFDILGNGNGKSEQHAQHDADQDDNIATAIQTTHHLHARLIDFLRSVPCVS